MFSGLLSVRHTRKRAAGPRQLLRSLSRDTVYFRGCSMDCSRDRRARQHDPCVARGVSRTRRVALSSSRLFSHVLWLRKMFNLFNKSSEANRDKRRITFNYYWWRLAAVQSQVRLWRVFPLSGGQGKNAVTFMCEICRDQHAKAPLIISVWDRLAGWPRRQTLIMRHWPICRRVIWRPNRWPVRRFVDFLLLYYRNKYKKTQLHTFSLLCLKV